ncbi:hypothetical protein IPF37_01175 [bacterium]|nr:MAG: hypothetical protein IPF37_01175 [bacterium]
MKKNIAQFLCVLVLQTTLCTAQDFTTEAAQSLQTLTSNSDLPLHLVNKINNAALFKEEELIALMSDVFTFLPSTDKNIQKIQSIQQSLITKLRNYKVTGVSFAVDPNFAFFVETQNPEFTVQYKDQAGNVKMRSYKANINTIGLKLELSLKLDLIFFVNTDMNFFDSNKEIKFGNGIDANIAMFFGCGVTYASFANMPGGMLILSLPLFLAGPSLSLVTGGSLIPA